VGSWHWNQARGGEEGGVRDEGMAGRGRLGLWPGS
jgi:hypothetical protein